MIEYLGQAWQLFLDNPIWASLFWSFCLVKAFGNALKHNYASFKKVLGIPDKWDWYFDPRISWHNKNASWWMFFLTPFSDFWHSLWTAWQFYYVIAVSIKTDNWILGVLMVGIPGVFIIFNGFYNWLKQTKFIKWL